MAPVYVESDAERLCLVRLGACPTWARATKWIGQVPHTLGEVNVSQARTDRGTEGCVTGSRDRKAKAEV